ncbi:hypothetical protein Syun_028001 [Stephania yunnanensis]|uniref:Uncharacterized protein n=1 Tax=Stephania yunnanensis TaxID=152371 RepID=A0AAP0HRR9_9MAGN
MACKLILVVALGVLLGGFMLSADARKLVKNNRIIGMATSSVGKGERIVVTDFQNVTVLSSYRGEKGPSVGRGILLARPTVFVERSLEMSVPSPGVGH